MKLPLEGVTSPRPSREQALIETAYVWSLRSTCSRLQVGAVIHREGRILTLGYNGAPSGLPHCIHEEWVCDSKNPQPMSPGMIEALERINSSLDGPTEVSDGDRIYWDGKSITMKPSGQPGGGPPCTQAEHAERNAIAFAARWGVALEGAELVVTHQPCKPCAMSIVNTGIKKVLYVEKYRLSDGVDLLNSAGVEVVRFIAEDPMKKIW